MKYHDQDYIINLCYSNEHYDIDEIEGIAEQMIAINNDWADPIIPILVEFINDTYVWEAGKC